jgi:hypothetical protein
MGIPPFFVSCGDITVSATLQPEAAGPDTASGPVFVNQSSELL